MPRSTPEISSSVEGPSGVEPQRDVRHALQRHAGGGVGERAAVRALPPGQVRDAPVGLVADEPPVADDVPALRLDALVVVADGRQAVLGRTVAHDVHHLGAVLQAAELVRRRERGARVRRLVAQRAVQLGGVPDRLVDGQPQVGRVDDEVVHARLDRRRGQLLGEVLRDAGQLVVPVPGRTGEVFVAAPGGRGQAAHRVEAALVEADGGHHGREAHALLGGHRARGVGVELVLLHLEQ